MTDFDDIKKELESYVEKLAVELTKMKAKGDEASTDDIKHVVETRNDMITKMREKNLTQTEATELYDEIVNGDLLIRVGGGELLKGDIKEAEANEEKIQSDLYSRKNELDKQLDNFINLFGNSNVTGGEDVKGEDPEIDHPFKVTAKTASENKIDEETISVFKVVKHDEKTEKELAELTKKFTDGDNQRFSKEKDSSEPLAPSITPSSVPGKGSGGRDDL